MRREPFWSKLYMTWLWWASLTFCTIVQVRQSPYFTQKWHHSWPNLNTWLKIIHWFSINNPSTINNTCKTFIFPVKIMCFLIKYLNSLNSPSWAKFKSASWQKNFVLNSAEFRLGLGESEMIRTRRQLQPRYPDSLYSFILATNSFSEIVAANTKRRLTICQITESVGRSRKESKHFGEHAYE